MTKYFLAVLLCFAFVASKAQNRSYQVSNVQVSNDRSPWNDLPLSGNQPVVFTPRVIGITLERQYKLEVLSVTNLGTRTVYVCRDQHKRRVNVMLDAGRRMFLFDARKRYLVQFSGILPTSKLVLTNN